MLDVRTNILIDRETHRLLASLADQNKTSIGELVRKAIKKVYKEKDEEIIRRRTKAVKMIKELRKSMKPLPKGVTIKDLINWGRRY